MKKQKSKKKLNKTPTPELDATERFMAESSKEPVSVEALDLASEAPLGTDAHRDYTDAHRD